MQGGFGGAAVGRVFGVGDGQRFESRIAQGIY